MNKCKPLFVEIKRESPNLTYTSNPNNFKMGSILLLVLLDPGNVRELRNVIERAVLLSSSDTLSPEHVMVRPEKKEHEEYTDGSKPVLETVPRRIWKKRLFARC